MLDTLKSVKIMFDDFNDLSLGFVSSQIESVLIKIDELEQLEIDGQQESIKEMLSDDEAHAIIKAYCFSPKHRNHKFMFLRK